MLKQSNIPFKERKINKEEFETSLEETKFRGTSPYIKSIHYLKSLPKSERPKILVYGDPDIDGLISMRELLLFLRRELDDNTIPYYCNTNRAHGFTLDAKDLKNTWVFGVDFSVEKSKLDELVENGVTVLMVDHHECQDEFIRTEFNGFDKPFGFVINNQYPFENSEWLFQSGMGVLYHVLGQYYYSTYGTYSYFYNKETRGLVGLTLLSDVRNIEMDYARPFLEALYSHDRDGYIDYLVKTVIKRDFTFGVPIMDRNFVDFTFSPKVNSLFRFNLEDAAIDFILGRGYPDEDYQLLQREFVNKLEENIVIYEFPNLKIIEIPSTGLSDIEKSYVTNFVGLLASRYVTNINAVIAYYNDNGVVGRASFRASIQDIDFRRELIKIGIDGRGHASAYGILNFRKRKSLFNKASEVCTELFKKHTFKVEFYDIDSSLSMWVRSKQGYQLAKENSFRLSHNRIYLRFRGLPHQVKRLQGNDKYAIYDITGAAVRTFSPELDIADGLILPMLERGNVTLQLVDIDY